ncbi:RagB/SusD family nutrient uptake outer membrane protein [Chitinophaga sp. GCM10012297]|uniref:RagB/SusD family nutrient uptake outer membrane protein n=1 Tax=Chitinophaga chungangae TaxID=2821488 RepID=A0ABS3Y9K8_9BACT|nr:RagB/SusD family nutrient uptake outer membrane protein [Chitinophaga chungangae]MBO9151362.1 RagB/SusD family nutrient uptake outer membrane protein [Chitinophaga chungangae]
MNQLRPFTILWLLPLAICWQGCKKLITVDPPVSIIGTEEVFKTNAQANSALAGIYAEMTGNVGSMTFSNGGLSVYGGLSADELVPLTGTNNETEYQIFSNKLDYTNGIPMGIIWKPAYRYIYSANSVIEGIAASTSPQLEAAYRDAYTGEALFIRAFSYFYLTNYFGDVPLALFSDYNQTRTMRKTPQAEVYAQIVRDLEEAIRLLPGDSRIGGGERVRANKWAATALLARVQLFRGEWEAAAGHAGAVIGEGSFNLTADPGGAFLKASREAIWQLKPQLGILPNNGTWDGQNFLPAQKISGYPPSQLAEILVPEIFIGFSPIIVPPYYLTPQAAAVFEPGDKRKLKWIDSVPTPSIEPYNSIPLFYPRKYTVKRTSASGAIPEYNMILRLAEQYLIRAEARAQLNDLAGATADIDTVRHRAGLQPTTATGKAELLDAIAQERRAELFTEWGHRWLDLKRTGRAQTVLGAISTKQPWDNNQLLYPIPPEEISANPNLKQNPGY